MSSTLIGSDTMPPSNIPSSTGTTVRRSTASTTTNRLAWLQPSSFPQPLVQPTRLSRTSSPLPSLTPHQLQSSTLPSSISAYEHPINLADLPKCLQTALLISQMPHPPRTTSLSWSDQLRVRNHLCCPVLLQPPWWPTPISTQTFSEPSLKGSLQPSLDVMPEKPARSIALKNKSVGSMTMLSTTKTHLTSLLTTTWRTMDKFPISTSPSAMESSVQPNGSRGWMTEELPGTMTPRALMSPLILSTYMCKLTQLGMARKTPLNHSPPGSVPSSSGPAAISCTCSTTSRTLTTGGWLGRSPTSVSSIRKLPNSPCELKSYTKNST